MYDFYTEKPRDTRFLDIWLATLQPFGVMPKSNDYDLFVADNQQKQAQNFINQYASKFLIDINLESVIKGKKIKFSEMWKIY